MADRSERKALKREMRDLRRQRKSALKDVMEAQAMAQPLMERGMSQQAVYNMINQYTDRYNSLTDRQLSVRNKLRGGRGASNAANV